MSTFIFDVTFQADPVVEVEFPAPPVFDVEFVGVALPTEDSGGAVDSVNGQTGTVVLDADDVGAEPAGSVSQHNEETTNVHGLSDTSELETQTGAATKVATHEADTTNVHGITDTSVLETTTGAQAKADAKVADAINNGTTTVAPSQNAVFDALALKQDSSSALALGETSGTAYRGDRGKTAYDHSQVTGNPHGVTKSDVGLGSVTNADHAAALASHASDTANPHAVTKSQVGLGNADNTADTAKPVSTAQQTALDLKAPLASPTFTGTPAAPTASQGTNTTQVATTAYVQTEAGLLVPKSLFDANTILAATSDNTPVALTVGEATIVGRRTGQSIEAMTYAQLVAALSAYVAGGTDVPVADGGTGASTAAGAAANLSVIPSDGWFPAPNTWTYASATTFTISGVDRTAVFTPGTKIKLTQTTTKFFTVVSSTFSTNTTVTVTGGTDYTLANASITNPYFSYANPPDFPSAFSYTPTFTGFSADPSGPTTIATVGRWAVVAHRSAYLAGSGTSNATGMTLTTPIACTGAVLLYEAMLTQFRDNSTTYTSTSGYKVWITSGASTITVGSFGGSTAPFSTSGGKGVDFVLWYPI